MSDTLARHAAIAHHITRSIPVADLEISRSADIPDTFARRAAVLCKHTGRIGEALAAGSDVALAEALTWVAASAAAWLAALEEEAAR